MARVVNPSWWDTGEWNGRPLRHYLARHHVSQVFAFLKDQGVSYAAIAQATGLGAGRVSEIAHGKRRVNDYTVLERIAGGLRIPRPYMGLGFGLETGGGSGLQLHEEEASHPLDRRGLLGAVASIAVGAIPADVDRWLPSGSQPRSRVVVGRDDVEMVRIVTQLHRRLDARSGGGACLESARGYLTWAMHLLSADAEDEGVGSQLRVALADLHNLVGWLAHDFGYHDQARRHLTQSLVLARQADELPLVANSLYRLGRVSLHERVPETALHLFGLGQLAAQQSGCPASVAILHTNTAWAYAALGVPDRVVESLARARSELDRVDPQAAPAWTRFALAEADLHGISGVAYTVLASHGEHRHFADQALRESHTAVQLRRPEDRRSFVFDLISVAASSAIAGEIGEAVKYGSRALTLAENAIRSARVVDRLAGFWNVAAPHAERHPELVAVGSRLGALQAAAR